MAAILDDGKLTLSGFVGDSFWDDGFTHGEVIAALAMVDEAETLTVYINSGGGYATEGAAIHALLSRRPGKTNVVVDGIAASAASLIAMAGSTIAMSAGSVMMIHDPAGITWGDAAAHAKTIEALDALATAYARVYADKSGKPVDDCRAIMKAERWFTPEEAVAEGFADQVGEAAAETVAAFDYRIYAHAPKDLCALAAKQDWRLDAGKAGKPGPMAGSSAHQSRQTREPQMTDKERADKLAAENADLKAKMEAAGAQAVTADRDRRTAIMALDEAKGREALAEHLYLKGESVESAKAMLAVAPAGGPSVADEDERMRQTFAAGRNPVTALSRPGGQQPTRPVLSASDVYAKRRAG